MDSKTIRRLEKEFQAFPVMTSGAPDAATWDDELAKLDFRPSEDYVEFIRRFGGSIVGPYTVVGIGVSPAMGQEERSVSAFTGIFRADDWPGTENWIVFSKDLGGNPIGMDIGGIVWSWDHDAGEMICLADSFERFLLAHCLR